MEPVHNIFIEYAETLDLNKPDDANKIKDLILVNMNAICNNAFSEQEQGIDTHSLVAPLSLDLKTLKFFPQNTYSYRFTPQLVASTLGWKTSDDAKNINDFINFLTSYVPELNQLVIDGKKFTKYLNDKYKTLDKGLANLNEFYCKSQPTNKSVLSTYPIALERLKTCFSIVSGDYSSNGELPKQDLQLLDLERYASLKKVMTVGPIAMSLPKIEILGDQKISFFANCICMKKIELEKFCGTFETVLLEKDKDVIFAELLKNERFSDMHFWLAKKILRPKNADSDEAFDKRAESEPIKEALKFLENTISINNSLNQLKEIYKHFNFTDHFCKIQSALMYYKPFQYISIFQHPHTPTMGYPGLPIWFFSDTMVAEFVARVWMNSEKVNFDMATLEGKIILLKSATIILDKKNICKQKIDAWKTYFADAIPHVPELQAIFS